MFHVSPGVPGWIHLVSAPGFPVVPGDLTAMLQASVAICVPTPYSGLFSISGTPYISHLGATWEPPGSHTYGRLNVA